MMNSYDKNAPPEVVTDASPVGLGAILVQEQQGVKRAVAFTSRSLSGVERHYSQLRVATAKQKKKHWKLFGVVRGSVFIYLG